MFDERLMALCPESRKYIAGNIILQFLDLCFNTIMIAMIALAAQNLYAKSWGMKEIAVSAAIIAVTVILRFLTTKYAVRMSYLASRTVKQVMREKIYSKLLRLGTSYREHASTAELVQESIEGVDQLESYFGQYVPQFFYAFLAPILLFLLFGFSGSWRVAAVLLICVPLIPGAIIMVQKIAKRILAKYWGQYTQLGSTFLENLQGMTTLKTYQADEFKNKEMNRESELFKDTIAGNIRVAKLDASQEEIETACKKASIHDFIMTLPKGYETEVGELGEKLSGGERQRIGLARAFLHNAPFLLLDEPTSNLDSLNEAAILKSLKDASAGKTVVLVSHRKSTVRIADSVIQMEGGRLS